MLSLLPVCPDRPLWQWEQRCLPDSLAGHLVGRLTMGPDRLAAACAPWYRRRIRQRMPQFQPAGATPGRGRPAGGAANGVANGVGRVTDPGQADILLAFGLLPEDRQALAARTGRPVWFFSFDAPDGLAADFMDAAAHVPVALCVALPGGACRILHDGAIRKYPGLRRSLAEAMAATADWLSRTVRQYLADGTMPDLGPAPVPAPAPAGPAQYRLEMRRRVAATWQRYFLLDIWNVGLAGTSRHALAAGSAIGPIDWLPRQPGIACIADPFPVEPDGTGDGIMVEAFDHGRQPKGWIARIAASGGPGAHRPAPRIVTGTHMSYPLTFRHAGRLFCMPEAHESGGVTIYEADDHRPGNARPGDAPPGDTCPDDTCPDDTRLAGCRFHGWRPVARILEGRRIVDPTPYHDNGLWWLFAGDEDDFPLGKLHCFYARTLFGPWQPHRLNPVKCDIRASRPAGALFRAGGRLIRPAQDCAAHYGSAVQLCEIRRLTPTAFEERPIARIAPDPDGPCRHGLHTLNVMAGGVVVDGLYRRLHPLAALFKARTTLATRKRQARIRKKAEPAA